MRHGFPAVIGCLGLLIGSLPCAAHQPVPVGKGSYADSPTADLS